MNRIALVLATFMCLVVPQFGQTESFEDLKAKLTSMKACQRSLTDENCKLDILDLDFRKLLEFQDQSKKTLNKLGGTTTSTLTGAHEFFTDTVNEATDETIKLMGGSIWIVTPYYYASGYEDVVGVLTSQNTANLYINGNTYSGELVKGNVLTSSGIVASVIDEKGDGTFLELDNGTYLFFGSYEAYDTGWWMPPYQVLIDTNLMNMWNLENGKKVWIESSK